MLNKYLSFDTFFITKNLLNRLTVLEGVLNKAKTLGQAFI